MLVFHLIIVYFTFDTASASQEEKRAFQTWLRDFDIVYDDNETMAQGYLNFCYNLKQIKENNRRYFDCKVSYALGLWKKSDMNVSELNVELNGLSVGLESRTIYIGGTEVKKSNVSALNYTEMGYVARVQDQGISFRQCFIMANPNCMFHLFPGNCGSCWAFARFHFIFSFSSP